MTLSNKRTGLGEAIRDLRERLGLTYGQMGVKAGLDPSTIWKGEQGKRLRMETVIQLAEAFGEDANLWLEKAEYPRLEQDSDPIDAAEQFVRAVERETGTELTYELDEEEGAPGAGLTGEPGDDRTRAVIARLYRAARELERKRWGIGEPEAEPESGGSGNDG